MNKNGFNKPFTQLELEFSYGKEYGGMRNCGVIVMGKPGVKYEVFKCGRFNRINQLSIDTHTLILTERHGLAQVRDIYVENTVRGTGKRISDITILWGSMAPMAETVTVDEFRSYNPILIKLKEFKGSIEVPRGSYVNRMSSFFPFFKIHNYNILEGGEC